MNLSPTQKTPAISSLEIATLTGKSHRHVTRDIESTLAEAKIDASKFGHIYHDGNNRQQRCYNLPRFECDLVVSGYSVPYRAAIIRRWHELEAAKAAPTLSRKDDLIRELVSISAGEISIDLLGMFKPQGEFGSVAKNGKPRVGFRAAAWVASTKSRLEEAAEINRDLLRIGQLELALGCLTEGGSL